MMPATTALIFLPFALVIGFWVTWKDLATMKIPNASVLALAAVWLVLGPLLMPWQDWLWGWGFAAITFALGLVCYLVMGVGAGDVKFATVIAPFFVGANLLFSLKLIAACMIGGLVCHQIAQRLPLIRKATPNWKSWEVGRVMPFGLCLSGILILHLAVAAMQ